MDKKNIGNKIVFTPKKLSLFFFLGVFIIFHILGEVWHKKIFLYLGAKGLTKP